MAQTGRPEGNGESVLTLIQKYLFVTLRATADEQRSPEICG